jgi:hypothetical protein
VVGVRTAVPSGREGGSYGPLSAAENTAATTTAATKQAGASTTTSATRATGRTHPPRTYHNNAANTTIAATDSHHGNPRISKSLTSYTPPPSYPPRGPRGVMLRRIAPAPRATSLSDRGYAKIREFINPASVDTPLGRGPNGPGARGR